MKLQNAVRRDITITGGATIAKDKPEAEPVYAGDPARIWTVNGANGDRGHPAPVHGEAGQVVVLAIETTPPSRSRLHLHGHAFRLLHPLDDGWEPYWLDTFQLLEGRTARIAFLADNPGRWLLAPRFWSASTPGSGPRSRSPERDQLRSASQAGAAPPASIPAGPRR